MTTSSSLSKKKKKTQLWCGLLVIYFCYILLSASACSKESQTTRTSWKEVNLTDFHWIRITTYCYQSHMIEVSNIKAKVCFERSANDVLGFTKFDTKPKSQLPVRLHMFLFFSTERYIAVNFITYPQCMEKTRLIGNACFNVLAENLTSLDWDCAREEITKLRVSLSLAGRNR